MTTWTTNVEEDKETGEFLITFPDDLMEQLGWKEGDTVSWEQEGDNWILRRKE